MPARHAGGPPQFLVIGHVVQDLISDEQPPAWRLGGAVSYASVLARNLGLRTAVLTAASPGLHLGELLPGVECHVVPSERTTQMRNVYGEDRRRQFVPQRGDFLRPEDLPDQWRSAEIVLLGPVAGEVDDRLAASFPGSLVGAGAQGWLREIAPDHAVRPVPPASWNAEPVLRPATALFLSDEDVLASEAPAALKHWSGLVDIVAFTRGYGGADVGFRGEWRHIEAFPAEAVDLTGAGDVFAAGFLICYHETGDPWEATRFGSCAASFAVEGVGIAGIPNREQIEDRLRRHPEVVAR
jgi:1D-myo-inositol 3-kinase